MYMNDQDKLTVYSYKTSTVKIKIMFKYIVCKAQDYIVYQDLIF